MPVHGPMALGAMALQGAGAAVSAMGTLAGGRAAAAAGQSAMQAAEFTAAQQRQQANEALAVGQRGAFEKRREGDLLQSKLQARAAASGGGATDPTVIGLAEDIAGRAEEGALFEMFKGESKRRGLLDAAEGTHLQGLAALEEGQMKQRAARLSALGTVLGGAGSMFGTYKKMS